MWNHYWDVIVPIAAVALIIWVAWDYLMLLLCKAWAKKDCPFCKGRGCWEGSDNDGSLTMFRCECTNRK